MQFVLLVIFFPILVLYGWGICEVAIQMMREPPGEGIVIHTNPIYDIFQESFAKQERNIKPSVLPPQFDTPGFGASSDMMTHIPGDEPDSEEIFDPSDMSPGIRRQWVDSYRRRKEFNEKKYMKPKDDES